MNRSIIKLFLLLLLIVITTACGVSKNDEKPEKLTKRKSWELVSRLDYLSTHYPDFFYSKLSSKYKSKENNISFKTSVRIKKDSAMSALITYARLPIYNTLITKDTLKIVDKRNKCYTLQNIDFLKENFNIDFKLKNIEELVLGMPISWDTNSAYYHIKDPYNYRISSHRKRAIQQLKKDKERKTKDDLFFQYFLTDDALNLKRIVIDSPKDSTHIQIDYLARTDIEGYSIPTKSAIKIETPQDTLFIDLKYSKVKINQPSPIKVTIPQSYDECE